MDQIEGGPNFVRTFTDCRKLLYVFVPLTDRSNTPRYVLSNFHPWGIFLSRFDFVITHIDGSRNIFAHLLTRWSEGHRTTKALCGNLTVLFLGIVPIAHEGGEPLNEEIRRPQQIGFLPFNRTMDLEVIITVEGKVWISEEATELTLIIMIECHCSSGGHRGKNATCIIIQEKFHWTYLKTDDNELDYCRLLCFISWAGDRITLCLSAAWHGKRRTKWSIWIYPVL